MDGTGPGRTGRASRAPGAALTRRARRISAVAAAAVCALPATGCGNGSITIVSPSVMTINSGEFQQNQMPTRYTCASGARVPTPPLNWSGEPAGTKSIALVVDDSDAPITPYVYWIVFDINPATSDILEGQLPTGARQAQNSAGRAAYDAPCPGPRGHWYRFTVYALNTTLNLKDGASLMSTWMAIAAATIGRGRKTVIATS